MSAAPGYPMDRCRCCGRRRWTSATADAATSLPARPSSSWKRPDSAHRRLCLACWFVAGREGQALLVLAVCVAREEQRSVEASACPRHCFGARRVVESLQDGSNSILIVGGSNVAWPKDVNAFAQQIRGASAVLLQREIPEYVNEACSLKPGEDRCESAGTAGWHLMLSLPACFVFFLVFCRQILTSTYQVMYHDLRCLRGCALQLVRSPPVFQACGTCWGPFVACGDCTRRYRRWLSRPACQSSRPWFANVAFDHWVFKKGCFSFWVPC